MKIVRERTVVESTTILDVVLGGVFECKAMWPGKVFMRIWSDRSRKIRFVDISADAGHMYTYSVNDIMERNLDYRVVIYPNATVNLGEPI